MKIRKANRKDAMEIARVHTVSWKETYKGMINQDFLGKLSVAKRLVLWNEILSNADAIVYVAVNRDDEIIGFASFGAKRPETNTIDGELYAIYLLEEYKRKGIGRLLWEAGLKDLIASGFSTMSVWVLAANPSRAFYQLFAPVKVMTETVSLGDDFYEEVLYCWHDLHQLLCLLKK